MQSIRRKRCINIERARKKKGEERKRGGEREKTRESKIARERERQRQGQRERERAQNICAVAFTSCGLVPAGSQADELLSCTSKCATPWLSLELLTSVIP